ncbi:hypothetical protein [Lacticaseibacillus hulanensis]|uniref:hypothetical protein n=1 Tax=Lacticaseibacillus hulanensis TaxID=2493111 RepID=UPI000FD782E6|nr:hypothetical protein [Lacticaseibacillus hulanensis]
MAHPRMTGLLAKVRQLSPKPDDQDAEEYQAITEFALDKTIDDVANYCHIAIADLPAELDTTIVAMTLNAITEMGLLQEVSAGEDGPVTSLSEGDTSVSFLSPTDAYKTLAAGSTITTDYKGKLNSFRVVQW